MRSEETNRTPTKKAYNHQRGWCLSGGFHNMVFIFSPKSGCGFFETAWDNDMGSQPAGQCFMEQFQDIISHAHEGPLGSDLHGSTQKEAAKTHILFRHGKSSLSLNTAIDPQEFPHLGIDLHLHFFALFLETLGNIDILAPLVHRDFALALDALVFQRTALAVRAGIDGGFNGKAGGGFGVSNACNGQLFSVGAGVRIEIGVVSHIFPAGNVGFVFPALFLACS